MKMDYIVLEVISRFQRVHYTWCQRDNYVYLFTWRKRNVRANDRYDLQEQRTHCLQLIDKELLRIKFEINKQFFSFWIQIGST